MRFKPVRFPQGYGMTPNITSWGGGAIFDGHVYHAYIHTLANHCPLACGANSRIDHGVSKTITGPYEFRDVAVPVDARNSAPITLPGGAGFAIFHIFEGDTDPADIVHCPEPAAAAVSTGTSARFLCPNNTAPRAATAAVTQRAAQSAASAVAAVNSSGALSFADLPVRSHCLLLSAPPTFQCPSRQVLCCTCVRA